MEKVLDIHNLEVRYGTKVVINNLSFTVNKGDYLAVIGENGTGKTTLIKGILGLIPTKYGSIEKLYTKVGYLPQTSDIKEDFPATVLELVCHPSALFVTKKDRQTAISCLEKLSIAHLSNTSYSSLSGGQKQRVLLARALNYAPDFLILDEPVSGLDPKITEELYTLVQGLNTTVLMVTHDIYGALKYANRVLCLGDNFFFGSKDDYVKSMAQPTQPPNSSQTKLHPQTNITIKEKAEEQHPYV